MTMPFQKVIFKAQRDNNHSYSAFMELRDEKCNQAGTRYTAVMTHPVLRRATLVSRRHSLPDEWRELHDIETYEKYISLTAYAEREYGEKSPLYLAYSQVLRAIDQRFPLEFIQEKIKQTEIWRDQSKSLSSSWHQFQSRIAFLKSAAYDLRLITCFRITPLAIEYGKRREEAARSYDETQGPFAECNAAYDAYEIIAPVFQCDDPIRYLKSRVSVVNTCWLKYPKYRRYYEIKRELYQKALIEYMQSNTAETLPLS